MPKLFAYKPKLPWSHFLQIKFDQAFGSALRDADAQVAGGRRLLPFADALGVAIIVNEGSANLPHDVVLAYLTRAIHGFANLNAILYLADIGDKPHAPSLVIKRDDPLLKRFSTQVLMMLNSFDYGHGLPLSRSGPQPELVARIEMDARSRAMYRSWATGWRCANNPAPVPSPSMRISFVRIEQFVSGLPRTSTDAGLLDLKISWDPNGKNLRIDNGASKP